jgi:hypothetical protein
MFETLYALTLIVVSVVSPGSHAAPDVEIVQLGPVATSYDLCVIAGNTAVSTAEGGTLLGGKKVSVTFTCTPIQRPRA